VNAEIDIATKHPTEATEARATLVSPDVARGCIRPRVAHGFVRRPSFGELPPGCALLLVAGGGASRMPT
jgi:hypothetical protein